MHGYLSLVTSTAKLNASEQQSTCVISDGFWGQESRADITEWFWLGVSWELWPRCQLGCDWGGGSAPKVATHKAGQLVPLLAADHHSSSQDSSNVLTILWLAAPSTGWDRGGWREAERGRGRVSNSTLPGRCCPFHGLASEVTQNPLCAQFTRRATKSSPRPRVRGVRFCFSQGGLLKTHLKMTILQQIVFSKNSCTRPDPIFL